MVIECRVLKTTPNGVRTPFHFGQETKWNANALQSANDTNDDVKAMRSDVLKLNVFEIIEKSEGWW
jgi:hypothetical protein